MPDRPSTVPAERPASGASERRRRIVDAALHLFSECDYDQVQMDEVARIAGVAKPTLYRYFPTKEALFLEGIERILCELQAEVEQAEGDPRPSDALRAVIRHVFLALARCTAAIHAFDGSDTQLGERGRTVIRARVRSIRVVVERILARGVASGQFRPMDETLAAVAVLGSIRMSAALTPDHRHVAALRFLTDFVERGVSLAVPAEPDDFTADLAAGGAAASPDPFLQDV